MPKSDKWGCLAAALVGVPVFLFFLGMDALGDCATDASCRKGFLLMVLVPSSMVTLLVFGDVRRLARKSNVDRD